MVRDMTEGSPAKIITIFTLPMLLSIVFQQMYNIADSVIAGKFIGVNALAAVGTSSPVTFIFLAFATGGSIGCSVIVGQLFGAKELGDMKTAIFTSIWSLLALSLVLTGIGLVICRPLLLLVNTPADIFSDAALYLRIYILGLLFLFLYNAANAILTGLGDSKTPLLVLIFSSVCNILLDWVCVIVLRMGVAGVAWATFIAQGIASLLAILNLLLRLQKIKTAERYQHFDRAMFVRMSKIAVPSILQQSFISVGQLCVQGLINGFGPAVIAGFSAAFKVNSFIVCSVQTVGNALSSFCAQNIGARKLDRVRRGFWAGCWISALFCAVLSVLLLVFGKYVLYLFMDDMNNTQVLSVGLNFTWVVTPFYYIVTVKALADGVLRGAGAMRLYMAGTLLDLVLRVALAYLLAPWLGYAAIYWAIGIGWVFGSALSLLLYFSRKWASRQ